MFDNLIDICTDKKHRYFVCFEDSDRPDELFNGFFSIDKRFTSDKEFEEFENDVKNLSPFDFSDDSEIFITSLSYLGFY